MIAAIIISTVLTFGWMWLLYELKHPLDERYEYHLEVDSKGELTEVKEIL